MYILYTARIVVYCYAENFKIKQNRNNSKVTETHKFKKMSEEKSERYL